MFVCPTDLTHKQTCSTEEQEEKLWASGRPCLSPLTFIICPHVSLLLHNWIGSCSSGLGRCKGDRGVRGLITLTDNICIKGAGVKLSQGQSRGETRPGICLKSSQQTDVLRDNVDMMYNSHSQTLVQGPPLGHSRWIALMDARFFLTRWEDD